MPNNVPEVLKKQARRAIGAASQKDLDKLKEKVDELSAEKGVTSDTKSTE